MAFVPEGQPDSSQARSAWVAMQKGPRPGGTVEVIVSPEWHEDKGCLGWSFVPKGQEVSAQGFNPISANLMRGPSIGRRAFDPEGQADSSQARKCLGSDAESPRPGGTVEVIISSRDLGTPGTSCLATIMLSLWDKRHSPRRGFVNSARRFDASSGENQASHIEN